MADDGVKAVAAPEPAALDDENDDARSVDSDELDSLEQTSNMDQDKYDDFVATCQVLPECVYTGMESKEHYAASMRKAHTLSVDTLETAREHRWKLAEQKLSRRSMCSPTSVLRKRWDAAQVSLLPCAPGSLYTCSAPSQASSHAHTFARTRGGRTREGCCSQRSTNTNTSALLRRRCFCCFTWPFLCHIELASSRIRTILPQEVSRSSFSSTYW